MGRKKIKITYIEDTQLRKVTCCKRKKGLLKKAMEFSLLCGNDVLLVIRDNQNDQVIMYNSLSSEDITLFNNVVINKEYNYVCSNDDVKFQ